MRRPRRPSNSRPFLPLAGRRVLSFEFAYSLPAGTRTLAELGAEVVRVSGPPRDNLYVGHVDGVFLSKSCIGINLKNPDGLELARRLAARADVICSNFVPGVMERLGLGPGTLSELNPSAIVLELSGFGSPGPWSGYPAFGPSTEAAGGLNSLTGKDPDPPIRVGSGVFSDQLGGRFAALAILAALERRQRTGAGAYIDVSMTEAITTLIGHTVLDAALGRPVTRHGNRDRHFAPQGVYRTRGDDEWIAITVRDDSEWRALVESIGDPALEAPAFSSRTGRQEHHDMIDRAIEAWTTTQERAALAERLQARGIAAAAVQPPRDLLFDPHLAGRGLFQQVEHQEPVLGYTAHPHPTTPWQMDGHARASLADVRQIGADNASVLGRWLEMDAAEVNRLEQSGALVSVRGRVEDRPASQRDRDFGVQLGLPGAGDHS